MRRADSLKKTLMQKEKRAAEDEMVRQHLRLSGHESEQTSEDSEGQGSMACCSPWGHKETQFSDRTTTRTTGAFAIGITLMTLC